MQDHSELGRRRQQNAAITEAVTENRLLLCLMPSMFSKALEPAIFVLQAGSVEFVNRSAKRVAQYFDLGSVLPLTDEAVVLPYSSASKQVFQAAWRLACQPKAGIALSVSNFEPNSLYYICNSHELPHNQQAAQAVPLVQHDLRQGGRSGKVTIIMYPSHPADRGLPTDFPSSDSGLPILHLPMQQEPKPPISAQKSGKILQFPASPPSGPA
jgi:hypothetical protein